MRAKLVREPFKTHRIVPAAIAVSTVALGAVLSLALLNGDRPSQRAHQSAAQPAPPIVPHLVDERTLSFAPPTDELALDQSPVVSSLSPPHDVETTSEAAAPLDNSDPASWFGPKSVAIVPDKWPRARMKYVIGATALVQEAQSDLEFQARVDTGAHSCSLHVEEFVINDEAESMEDNIGKEIRFKVTNHEGASQWIKSIVDCCARVRTSDHIEERYKVPVSFRWNDFERMVLVTLNNRARMTYPLLLGRNFLQSDFVVDVALDGEL